MSAAGIATSRLSYELRVRDLVHGFVYLTPLEVQAVDHPLFQRLRYVRQNDVASYVYPSVNTSRFEHALGTVAVAGRMAINLMRSPEWSSYRQALGLDEADFEQACRLYALLHDIGHLPLSHLFEIAAAGYEVKSKLDLCRDWFGGDEGKFTKLHEACGSALVGILLNDIKVPDPVKSTILHIMTHKTLAYSDPRRPIKLLLDSEIDADRIDFTARDGLLAGGEYGHYDIERLCSAVFLKKYDNGDWGLAYSHKALGSIEALLLDRYRVYTWIHFHHQVVAVKLLLAFVIERLLADGRISKADFPVREPPVMALRDDVWLWNLIRNWSPPAGSNEAAARTALLYRDKSLVTLLWKNRAEYNDWMEDLAGDARMRDMEMFTPGYDEWLTKELGKRALTIWLKFSPTEKFMVPLTSEDGREARDELLEVSALAKSLSEVWEKEPQGYIILLGKPSGEGERRRVHDPWVKATAKWVTGDTTSGS